MQLGFGLRFNDLYERAGLLRVDAAFLSFLGGADAALREKIIAARKVLPSGREESDLLVALAPHVEDFVAKLFGIEDEAQALAARHNELAPLYSVKRLFVQRRALHKVKPEDAKPDGFDFSTELDFAQRVSAWLKDETANAAKLEAAARYAAWATTAAEGKKKHRSGVLFKTPTKLDFMRLIPVHTESSRGFAEHTSTHLRQREGFQLTDKGTDLTGALDEVNYCIWCHEQGKDSCSKGLKEKAPAEGFRKTVFGVPLANEKDVLELAFKLEVGAARAYLTVVDKFQDRALAASAGRILSDEVLHATVLRSVLGRDVVPTFRLIEN